MVDVLKPARDKLSSGFIDTGPEVLKSVPPDPDQMSLEARILRVEQHLGIVPKPAPPRPPTHAICAYSGLRLPAKFFGVPTTATKPVSQFFNAYKSAHPDDRMAIPKTISQETFDKHQAEFFPDNVPLSSKRIGEFLTFAAINYLGQTPVQMFTNQP